jgi:hypothetical protein
MQSGTSVMKGLGLRKAWRFQESQHPQGGTFGSDSPAPPNAYFSNPLVNTLAARNCLQTNYIVLPPVCYATAQFLPHLPAQRI